MNSYYLSELNSFANALQTGRELWEVSFNRWLRKQIREIGQVEATKYVMSYDSAEPMDLDAFDRAAASFNGNILSALEMAVSKVRPGLRDSFVVDYEAYKTARTRLARLQKQSFCFCLKYRKTIREAKQQCKTLDKEFGLGELLEIACSFYVEQGLGSADAARNYFLG